VPLVVTVHVKRCEGVEGANCATVRPGCDVRRCVRGAMCDGASEVRCATVRPRSHAGHAFGIAFPRPRLGGMLRRSQGLPRYADRPIVS
jgi:hypothetical protein